MEIIKYFLCGPILILVQGSGITDFYDNNDSKAGACNYAFIAWAKEHKFNSAKGQAFQKYSKTSFTSIKAFVTNLQYQVTSEISEIFSVDISCQYRL